MEVRLLPRPPKERCVSFQPSVTYYKPAGVPLRSLAEVRLQLDELEALRLKDLNGLDQVDCAREMGISQSTLQRVLAAARSKVAAALIYGKAIRIEGGPVAGQAAGSGHRIRSDYNQPRQKQMEAQTLGRSAPDPDNHGAG